MAPNPSHKINGWLIAETIIIFLSLILLANAIRIWIPAPWKWPAYTPVLFMMGLWLDRLYIVGHEASHKKLFPENKTMNDWWGSVILMPLMVPLRIYRKIHYFHHGFNRKDEQHSVLDVFVTRHKAHWWVKAWYHALWYLGVFFGGYFLHSLVSVLLFLFVPVSLSSKISPAFIGWKWKDQLISILLFLLGLGLHLAFFFIGGKEFYLWSLGYPMLMFAWLWSMLVYIYHYDTSIGDEVRYNVRSLKRNRFLAWALMNFNEHATHHQYPNIPWHELPQKKSPLPDNYQLSNQRVNSLAGAILQQLKGPVIFYEYKDKKS